MLRSFLKLPVKKARAAIFTISWRGYAAVPNPASSPSSPQSTTTTANSSLLNEAFGVTSNGGQRLALSAVEELTQMVAATSQSNRKKVVDRTSSRFIHITLRMVQIALLCYKELGLPADWPSRRRKEQMVSFGFSSDTELLEEKESAEKQTVLEEGGDTEGNEGDEQNELVSSASSEVKCSSPPVSLPSQHRLINLFTTYIRYDSEILAQLDAPTLPQRLRAKKSQEEVAPYRLDSLERQYILHLVCNAVEKREVALVIATRLLRRRWPGPLLDMAGVVHHRFLVKSIFAWIAEELTKDTLTSKDARAILDNSAFALKSSGTALVGKLAMVAIRDLQEKENPEALISLMWAVSSAGVHAPEAFWRQIFLRLVDINRARKGSLGSFPSSIKEPNGNEVLSVLTGFEGGNEGMSSSSIPMADNKVSSRKALRRANGSHVFSGLTTRQIYRILAVLKKERWSAEAGDMHELADQALKNIVFEAEALILSEKDAKPDVPKRVLTERLRTISDLSFQEFLSLLTIAGDLGVPFHISALRVSDILFVPLTRFLDQHQLLSLLLVVRQTRCYSPSLVEVIAKQIQSRGPGAHYALPLAKAFMRAVMKEKSLLMQPAVMEFSYYFLDVCANVAEKVRISELSSLADVVYALYRSHAPDSSTSHKCKQLVDIFCKQVDRVMQLQLTSTAVASKLLEYTILMGMRDDKQRYTNVASLLQTRNTASADNEMTLKEGVALLSKRKSSLALPTAESLPSVCEDENENSGSARSNFIIHQWSALEEKDLPTTPKAALQVYNELIYFFEKMAVVKSDFTSVDVEKFSTIFEQTGLYNVFLGSSLMQQAHLAVSSASKNTSYFSSLNALPVPIQRRVHKFIALKLLRIKNGSSKVVSEHELLQILGQVHCNEEKVEKLIQMIQQTPLVYSKQHRDIWLFVKMLANCFGSQKQQQKAEVLWKASLY